MKENYSVNEFDCSELVWAEEIPSTTSTQKMPTVSTNYQATVSASIASKRSKISHGRLTKEIDLLIFFWYQIKGKKQEFFDCMLQNSMRLALTPVRITMVFCGFNQFVQFQLEMIETLNPNSLANWMRSYNQLNENRDEKARNRTKKF